MAEILVFFQILEVARSPFIIVFESILFSSRAMTTTLGFKIAKQLLLSKDGGENKNVVFSPLSIHILMSIITTGSDGHTRDELLSFLQSKSIDDLNSFASQLFSVMSSDHSSTGGPRLSFANGVWVDKSFSLKPSFSQVVETTYKATVDSLDFGNKVDVANRINSWAEKETDGLIKHVISPNSFNTTDPEPKKRRVDPTDLIVANALYFKGSWEEPFVQPYTSDGDFHLLNGDSIKFPFMTEFCRKRVRAFDGFKVLGLPYKRGGDVHNFFKMYIFLPDEIDGLPALVDKVCSKSKSLGRMLPRSLVPLKNFRIPRFKISFEVDAASLLKDMGLVSPFTFDYGLTEVLDSDPALVDGILHKSVVEVNEKGTEAVAVTIARLTGGGPSPPRMEEFVADHPFLFLIREDSTGTILFIGQVLNPLDN